VDDGTLLGKQRSSSGRSIAPITGAAAPPQR